MAGRLPRYCFLSGATLCLQFEQKINGKLPPALIQLLLRADEGICFDHLGIRAFLREEPLKLGGLDLLQLLRLLLFETQPRSLRSQGILSVIRRHQPSQHLSIPR